MPYKDKTSQEAKASMKRRNDKYYAKNKEKIIEKRKPQMNQYYKDNKDKWVATTEQTSTNRRIRMFGVDKEKYQKMLDKQDNKCAICGVNVSELKYTLCVDHDHATGKVRGLLCHDCNVGIGRMKDNIKTLKKAIKYLSI